MARGIVHSGTARLPSATLLNQTGYPTISLVPGHLCGMKGAALSTHHHKPETSIPRRSSTHDIIDDSPDQMRTATRGGHADFRPVHQLRAHEYVAEQIRRQIGLRLIRRGQPLPSDRELAAAFGVGRATVQQAVRLLESDLLVQTRRGRKGGTFVVAPATDDLAMDYLLVRLRRDGPRIREALGFRATVEPAAAALAAGHRTRTDLNEIADAHQRAARADNDAMFTAHDTEFHLAIARASSNSFFYEAVERLRLVLNDALAALPESAVWRKRSVEDHEQILMAIRRRDKGAAALHMEEHLRATEHSALALLKAL